MRKNKLTFLLIHPEISRTKYNFVGIIENECLELEYISSMLKEKGHNVYLYDGQVETSSVSSIIKKYKPDVVYVVVELDKKTLCLNIVKMLKNIIKKL